MEAAYRCLAQPHAGPIPMTSILRSAGLSSRAFYRHFLSKDDLFLALLRQECEAVIAQVDRIADAAVGSPADQLADWIAAMFDIIVDPQQRLQLTVIDSDEVRAAKGYREMRERLHAERERSLAEILRRGRRDGSFPLAEPEIDAVAVNALVSRLLVRQTTDDPQARKQAEVAVLDFALRAVGAVPGGQDTRR
ncbi:TetR/AcrR family transcriptional regulator [Mycolicibacterium austroafricanum]|nr:TetR/AcrR family transcriptional regulator [Mycolicibacterium vanbaalenii PYR-1]PQP48886.1 TetR/AcrR family transcriptional regulator [Mycolicibacterium austroafricanum]QRZ10070.1 TetR/AcrR family transcriptional regulator [Mycolicibacterium austroafricanum]QZT60139.1 TetR/AcrR family transcriptional regulator [Mycolicibacterium austroafricanum]QZT71506.1 TetR/AcrR family transcriptional regulator [Mycolicibacterium austroafricanum]